MTKKQTLYGLRPITGKMLKAFITSENHGINGIGYNDNWNIDKYGITKAESDNIRHAMISLYGMKCFWPESPCITDININIFGA